MSASPLQAVFFLNSAPTYVRAARVTLVKMGDLVPAAAGEVPVGRQRKLNPDGTPRCHSAKQLLPYIETHCCACWLAGGGLRSRPNHGAAPKAAAK